VALAREPQPKRGRSGGRKRPSPLRSALLSRLKEVHRRADTRHPSARLWRDPTSLIHDSQSQRWRIARTVPLPLDVQRFPHTFLYTTRVSIQRALGNCCDNADIFGGEMSQRLLAVTSCSQTRFMAARLARILIKPPCCGGLAQAGKVTQSVLPEASRQQPSRQLHHRYSLVSRTGGFARYVESHGLNVFAGRQRVQICVFGTSPRLSSRILRGTHPLRTGVFPSTPSSEGPAPNRAFFASVA
jgi:hypothetical protein